jgi:hypothetical protein
MHPKGMPTDARDWRLVPPPLTHPFHSQPCNAHWRAFWLQCTMGPDGLADANATHTTKTNNMHAKPVRPLQLATLEHCPLQHSCSQQCQPGWHAHGQQQTARPSHTTPAGVAAGPNPGSAASAQAAPAATPDRQHAPALTQRRPSPILAAAAQRHSTRPRWRLSWLPAGASCALWSYGRCTSPATCLQAAARSKIPQQQGHASRCSCATSLRISVYPDRHCPALYLAVVQLLTGSLSLLLGGKADDTKAPVSSSKGTIGSNKVTKCHTCEGRVTSGHTTEAKLACTSCVVLLLTCSGVQGMATCCAPCR